MASSRRSTAQARSSGTTSRGPRATSTSSLTRSTSSTSERTLRTCAIALGSNLGDRATAIRRAIHELPVRVVRISSLWESEPVDAPPGSPPFLNAVVVGYTSLEPEALLLALLALETRLGRARPRQRNAPRRIDLDLIFHGARRMRTSELTLPHPRAHERSFVVVPMREVWEGTW